jgi:DNA mismatch repair protein MutL
MGRINLLETQVANLIAAGEVVERPASAVKELMENAIDAGATRITAEIKNGGVSLMRITDNGCGMTEEDALLCIQRHATSKIRSAADLDGIVTLGFRGEALAAIASVSKLRIMTRTADADMGVVVTCEAGKILSVEESGCPLGTTILVEELFANIPARRKFLKRDGGGEYVYILNGTVPVKRYVKLAPGETSSRWVLAGLTPGQVLVQN